MNGWYLRYAFIANFESAVNPFILLQIKKKLSEWMRVSSLPDAQCSRICPNRVMVEKSEDDIEPSAH